MDLQRYFFALRNLLGRGNWSSWDRYCVINTEHQQKILFVHGGPDNPWEQCIFQDTDFNSLKKYDYDVIFIGQTHRPFIAMANNTQLINVGSCGLPRDVGDLASCVLYQPLTKKAEIIRIPFSAETVIHEAQLIQQIPQIVINCLKRTTTGKTSA